MKIFFVILTTAIVIIACRGSNGNKKFIEQINFGDSVKRYINTERKSIPVIKKITLALNLDSIYNGYNDFQMRIWLGHSMAINKNLVILKCSNKIWEAQILTYSEIEYNRWNETVKIWDYKNVIPKSGWTNFLKKMEGLNTTNMLKNSDSTNCCRNGDGGGDGIDYDFEIAEKNKYKSWNYWQPTDDSAHNTLAKNIIEFSEFLENEFAFRYIR